MDNITPTRRQSLIWLTVLALGLPALATETKQTNAEARPLLSEASYQDLQAGEFMARWLLLGPVPVSKDDSAGQEELEQKKAFGVDPLSVEQFRAKVTIGEKEYKWAPVASEGEVVNLVRELGPEKFATAYAWAQIRMTEEKRVLLGIGSDDAVKVWLNGKLVHENWVQRACTTDSDLVDVTFRQGVNHLVLKIQNGASDWAFCCRPLGPEALTGKLISAVRSGHLDPVTTLLEHGVDVNSKVGPGLTALHLARIAGRSDAIELLKAKGADTDIPMPAQGEIIDWLFERVIKENYPGAAVLVAQDGETLYQNGYGYANVENRVDITPETKFRIGSVSKQFVAVAILKLQEAGKLSVQDKLSKFLPDFPRGDEVTLHHLLTHTSGIHSYTSKPDFLKTVASEVTSEELVNAIREDEFDFDPGEKQDYCNSGYFLLGYIVEKISGKSLDAYLKETLFAPLGMKDTGIHHWSLILDHEATGYVYEGGELKKALDWDMSRAGGAGALYSTVGDLRRWNEAIFGGKVLNEASMKAAFTPAKLNNGDIAKAVSASGYGYGWDLGKLRGMASIAHGGGLHGFSSYLMHLPEKNLTVTVLVNSLPTIPELSSSAYARDIAEIYLFEEMAEQVSPVKDETVDPKIYDDYVGRYDYGNSMVLTVTREDNRLLAQLTGQGQAEIFPSSQREFFWKEVDARITFVRNEQGAVTGAVHRQGGNTLQVQRLEDEPVADIDSAIYNTYAGDYELKNVGTMTIVNEDGHLLGQLGNQPRFEMFPRTETEFFLKIVQASITFAKNQDGQVTGLTLKQSGMALTGKKKAD